MREEFGSVKRQHLNRAAAKKQAEKVEEVTGEPVQPAETPRQPWELVDDVMNTLKTAYPFQTLSMEKMVDQISHRAKSPPDEDIYRFFAALLNDAMQVGFGVWGSLTVQQRIGRSGTQNDDDDLPPVTKETLNKFASNLSGDLKVSHCCHLKLTPSPQAAIEADFMKQMPKMKEYIRRLQTWRDRFEIAIDARPKTQALDQNGCNLIDFHHNRFDDVEIPGQYVQVS